MKIVDAHLHAGNISDLETVSPGEVSSFLQGMGVSGGLVMPVAKCGGKEELERHRVIYTQAIEMGFDVSCYLNRSFLHNGNMVASLLGEFPFRAVKIHPALEWLSEEDMELVANIAEQHHIPLMIHTGYDANCQAGRFEQIAKIHPKLKLVLCHSRPAKEAFELMDRHDNVWIDTAFLPFEELAQHINDQNEDRILYGSDYPVNRWFSQLGNEDEWYRNQFSPIIDGFTTKRAEKILYENYERLYGEHTTMSFERY